MTIDVSKIGRVDARIIGRQFLFMLERDWENPQIRADFEKWKEKRGKENDKNT